MLKYIHQAIKQKRKQASTIMSIESMIETNESGIEPVTISELLASWDRPRSDEELRALRQRREEAIGGIAMNDVELVA